MCVLSPADLSDSTLSYTETEAASSSNATPGEFSGGCVPSVSLLGMRLFVPTKTSDPVNDGNLKKATVSRAGRSSEFLSEGFFFSKWR